MARNKPRKDKYKITMSIVHDTGSSKVSTPAGMPSPLARELAGLLMDVLCWGDAAAPADLLGDLQLWKAQNKKEPA